MKDIIGWIAISAPFLAIWGVSIYISGIRLGTALFGVSILIVFIFALIIYAVIELINL